MNPIARKATVGLLVVMVPLAIYHSASILTFLMNATRSPFGYARHVDIRYGEDPAHRLDVYVPKAAARAPVVILWHGGMWMKGSKDEVRFVGAALARSGYVTVIPNYRLYPQVRFPEFVDDGAQVVAWARKEIASFGGDPDAIFLMGHSAGAYIATMLAFDEAYLHKRGESANCIRGVIGMAGPYTLERPAVFLDSIFDKSVGSKWRPIDAVSAAAPPTLLLHGDSDNIVWVDEAKSLAAELERHEVSFDLRIYAERSHHDVLVAWWWPLQLRTPVRADVQRFIDSRIAGGTPPAACVPGS